MRWVDKIMDEDTRSHDHVLVLILPSSNGRIIQGEAELEQ